MFQAAQRDDASDLDLLGHVPANADRVLAFGVASQTLERAFRLRRPHGRWWAVDPADDTAITMSPKGELAAAIREEGPADVLLLDDVVQHLDDPKAALKGLVRWLAPGGTVVVRLTNPAHWTALRRLMQGEGFAEPLRRSGPAGRALDLQGLLDLIRAAGLGGAKLSVRHDERLSPRQQEIKTAFAGMAPVLGTTADVLDRKLSQCSYVVTARRLPAPAMLNVHHVAFAGFCLPPRIDLPCTIMNSLPGITATRTIGASHVLPALRDGEAWILVLQRQKIVDRPAFFAAYGPQVRRGWLLVAEWDDDPDLLPASIRAEWLKNPWLSISAVHACQVSTPRLQTLFGQHNPETIVFENGLAEIPPFIDKPTDTVRIVYGALNRDGVASLVQPAIDHVAARDPRVEVVIIHDRAVFDALNTPRKRFVPHLPYPDYLSLLETAHIALLPLMGRAPELGKSDLKFIESAGRSAAVLASPSIYEHSIRDGETGLLASTAAQWQDRLALLVSDDALRTRMAMAAWDYVARQRLIGHQVARREQWYRSLWQRRDELTRGLMQRHPEFAA